jgi:hypothetical protein
MDEQLQKLQNLGRVFSELEKATKLALGFGQTIEYEGISFDVSRRFVMADLAPLAFFHLVENIGPEGPQAAVIRLYDRLMPLLTCEHQWTNLKRVEDEHLRSLSNNWEGGASGPHVCRSCTAYALGSPGMTLPKIGRK